MKTIAQLLELAKNPHYKMTQVEKEVLDDFLSQKRGQELTPSPKRSSTKSSKKTRAIVRNVVKKTDTYPPEATESAREASEE